MRKILVGGIVFFFACCGGSSGGGGGGQATTTVGGALTSDKSAVIGADDQGNAVILQDGSMTWKGADGSSFVIYYGSDGFPTRLVVGDSIVSFGGWDTTNNTVNMGFVQPDGTTSTVHNVAVEPAIMSRLASMIAAGPSAMVVGLDPSLSAKAFEFPNVTSDDVVWGLGLAGSFLNAFGCGVGIGTAVTTGVGAPVALAIAGACGSTFVRVTTLLEITDENNVLVQGTEGGSFIIDAFSCASSSATDISACLGTGLTVAQGIVSVAGDVIEAHQAQVEVVEMGLPYGGGAVQVTLQWEKAVDVDLHVTDPDGEEISYLHSTSASGGYLDHDDIDGGSASDPAKENIFWKSNAPAGIYQVQVVYFAERAEGGAVDYQIAALVGGQSVGGPYTGTLTSANSSVKYDVTQFTVP